MPLYRGSRRIIMSRRVSSPGAPAGYSFRGVGQSSASGSVTNFSIDIGTASADRLVVVGVGFQGVAGITSVIVDPAGANVTLAQDAINASGNTSTLYSGLVTSGAGAKNIEVTLVSGSFLIRAVSVWTLTGLSSNLKKQSSAFAGTTGNINVAAGDFLFAMAHHVGGTVTFSGSTEAPAAAHNTGNATDDAADWTVVATNASFALVPGSSSNVATTTYR